MTETANSPFRKVSRILFTNGIKNVRIKIPIKIMNTIEVAIIRTGNICLIELVNYSYYLFNIYQPGYIVNLTLFFPKVKEFFSLYFFQVVLYDEFVKVTLEFMMKLTESKSNLARLLAEENLIVEMRSGVQSAYFDGEARLLVIPDFKTDVSVNILDLMISHEVGHSLNTPSKEWIEAIESGISKGILNVVEDSRIELLIKARYPGLKQIYVKGYKELFNMDFFGLSKLDISNLNLIDRINLQRKVGYIQEISFNDEEKVFLEKVENVKSFSDVIKVSKELQEYIKEEYQNKQKEFATQFEFDEEESQSEDQETQEVEIETQEIESESDNMTFDSNELDSDFMDELEDHLRSFTDEASQEEIKKLYSEDNKETVYVDTPDINLNDYIVKFDHIISRLKYDVPGIFTKEEDKFNKFKAENANIVSYLVKEFTLKKNAQGRKKIKESKTGDINLNKLYSYKVNNDIFRRSTKVPGEKNHSMIFYLDWSGSMDPYFTDTIKQLLCLVMFCKKLNIPYEVYAFTTSYFSKNHSNDFVEEKERMMILNGTKLMNLFSYKMTNNQFIDMANVLLSYHYFGFSSNLSDSKSYNPYCTYRIPSWFILGNTPLNHSVILSQKVSDNFKAETKTDILNNIFLTDGVSHGISFKDKFRYSNLKTYLNKVFIRNKKSKVVVRVPPASDIDETNACVQLAKESTGHRYMAFRIINRNELRNRCFDYFNSYDYTKVWNMMKKENCVEVQKTAFDKFFFIRSNLISVDEELAAFEKDESTSSIYKKFGKTMAAKTNNRIFIKKFVEFIS